MANFTILKPKFGQVPTKNYEVINGELSVVSYPKIKCWTHDQIEIPDIQTYHAVLTDLNGFILIRGALVNTESNLRNGNVYQDHGCGWVMIDVDGVDLPNTIEGVQQFIDTELPPEFHGVACSVQFSSSAEIYEAGEPYKPGLHCHAVFFLDRLLFNNEVKHWLKGCPIDFNLFTSAQPHYVSPPMIGTGVDCRLEQRNVFLDGEDSINVPDLGVVPPRPVPRTRSNHISNFAPKFVDLLLCDFIRHFVNNGIADGEGRYEANRAFCHNVALTKDGAQLVDAALDGYEHAEAIHRSLQRFLHPICCSTFLPMIDYKCPKFDGEQCITGARAPIAIAGRSE